MISIFRSHRPLVASRFAGVFLGVACVTFSIRAAEIELVSDKMPVSVFGGGVRKIHLKWHNPGTGSVEIPIQVHLIQASSSTVAPWLTRPWKTLSMLPEQTVLESAELELPAVRGKTRFVVQWLGPKNQVLGTSTLDVFPNDLLKELAFLSGHTTIGLFDPSDLLQGTLRNLNVINLLDHPSIGFDGKLAIITRESEAGSAAEQSHAWVTNLAHRGIAVLWIQSPSDRSELLQPSFYIARKGAGTVVVAQSFLVSNLPDNPKAQLNLLDLARLAVLPESARCDL